MSDRPGLIRRIDRTGVPLILCRIILGVMFTGMGLAKTGLVKTVLTDTGLIEHPVIVRLTNPDTGYLELSSSPNFLHLLREYKMFPESAYALMNFTVVALPWVETLCGVLLLLGVAVRGASLMLAVMLCVFTPMVLMRALGIFSEAGGPFCEICFNCGCGAGDVCICDKMAENITLLVLTLIALISRTQRFCLRPALLRTPAASATD